MMEHCPPVSKRFVVLLTLISVSYCFVAQSDLVFPDGSVQSTAAPSRARVVHIAASGSGTNNGNRLRNAVDAIGDASANKPYLVLLDPGRYNLGAASLNLKPYVSLQGALAEESEIAGNAATIVQGANAATLRDLTIESADPGTTLYKLSGDDGLTEIATAMRNVVFELNMNSGTGVAVAIDNDASAVLTECTIRNTLTGTDVSRTGILIAGGLTLSTNIEFWNGSIQFENSGSLASATAANVGSGATLHLRGSTLQCENAIGDGTRTGLLVASGGKATGDHCGIDAADFVIDNSGVYDAFAVDHVGSLPAENPPSSDADTTYTLYLQCTLNGAEI